ncbi:MAG: hypothetical protein AAB131_14550 [Actinomycetota bacterium]
MDLTGVSVPVPDLADPDTRAALRMLLTQSEYGIHWTSVPVPPSGRASLNGRLASGLERCDAYAGVVFGVSTAEAAALYYHPSPALMGEFVTVLSDEDAAHAMFDALDDPDFATGCAADIIARSAGQECCDLTAPALPNLLRGDPVQPAFTPDAGVQIAMGRARASWIDTDGVQHGPESVLSATIRVGRAVLTIEALEVNERGETVMSEPDFEHTVQALVTKAEMAQVVRDEDS